MRVLFGLLLLALSAVSALVINPDATNTFHATTGDPGNGWFIGGAYNPTLNMSIGTTYFISIEFDTTLAGGNHPFGFNTASGTPAVSEMGLVNVNTTCGGSANPGYTASAAQKCVLAFTPNATTPATLWYHCSVHGGMKGQIQVNGVATPAPATTAPPSTPAPTSAPTSGASIVADATTNIFHITGGNATAGWTFTSGGQQFLNPTLNMTAGTTYFFSIEFDTVATFHPFGLNAVSGTGTNGNNLIPDTTLGLTNTTVCVTGAAAKGGFQSQPKCTLSFTPNPNTQALYYHCLYHSPMWGQIQVLAASGSTTSPPTTPHGSASALVPGVAAVFAAVAGFAAL